MPLEWLAGVENESHFKEWLKSNDYVQLVDNLVESLLNLSTVESWRLDAKYKTEALAGPTIPRTCSSDKQRKAKYSKTVKEETKRRRDLILENAVLFLQHGLMYLDFWIAMRAGDSGRLEFAMDLMTVFEIFMVLARETTLAKCWSKR